MQAFLTELWMILVESSLWLILGFAIAGAVHALVPRQWMLKHLSGGGFWPIAKASMLGIPLPLCSCSVIPVAAGLRSQGASKGASAAFAISTPQTGEESIPITWALFGPVYAFTRPIVAVITGLIAGLLIDFTGKREEPTTPGPDLESDPGAVSLSITNADDAGSAVAKVDSCCSAKAPDPVGSCCSGNTPQPASSCCSSEASPAPTHTGAWDKVKIGFKHGFGTMLIDLAVWLTIGLLLAALIGALVPQDWIAEHVGTGIMPKLVMLLVGIPLYICATSSTPLAWSLVAAGLSPGAALVMLLSGPATNVATMSWLIKDLGMRALVIYLGVIAAVALTAGIVFDAFFTRFVHIASAAEMHNHASMLQKSAAVVFILLMAWALGMRMRQYMNDKGWGTTGPAPVGGSCCSSNPSQSSCGCSKA
ncbi:MAG: SO_0444 family Cu/Zn efflux transporter [Phycisphaerales bacterium JB052]